MGRAFDFLSDDTEASLCRVVLLLNASVALLLIFIGAWLRRPIMAALHLASLMVHRQGGAGRVPPAPEPPGEGECAPPASISVPRTEAEGAGATRRAPRKPLRFDASACDED